MRARLFAAIAALSITLLGGCGGSERSSRAVTSSIHDRIEVLKHPSARVARERLLEPKTVARFYEARQSRAAWDRDATGEIVEAIRGVSRDGLNPKDYHLEAIEKLSQGQSHTPEAQADLDLLLTDAVAAIADHVRFGRVLPATLNPEWNVDPRAGAPPLETTVAGIAGTHAVRRAIEDQRPDHFIYHGLVDALARMREFESHGGWPTIPPGGGIRPGASDPRIPAIRARLAITGELPGEARNDRTTYDDALRRAVMLFKADHRLDTTAVIDRATIEAMNVSASARANQARANLERARWVVNGLKDDFVLVNLPAFKAYLIRNQKNVWEARTQIGDEAKQTPTFRADMRTVVFNPDWSVPQSILVQEILTKMQSGDNVIGEKGLVLYDDHNQPVDPSSIDWKHVKPESFPYTLKQPPGESNALGRVKFLFPNPYSIYLHDTPSRHLFASNVRTFSHGCIRLEHPLELAEILLKGQDSWNSEKINRVLETGETQNVELEHSLPVLIVYWTVSVGASGRVHFAHDIYDLDPPLLAALDAPPWSHPTVVRAPTPTKMGP